MPVQDHDKINLKPNVLGMNMFKALLFGSTISAQHTPVRRQARKDCAEQTLSTQQYQKRKTRLRMAKLSRRANR